MFRSLLPIILPALISGGCLHSIAPFTLNTIHQIDSHQRKIFYGYNNSALTMSIEKFGLKCLRRFLWYIIPHESTQSTFWIHNRKCGNPVFMANLLDGSQLNVGEADCSDKRYQIQFHDSNATSSSEACILSFTDISEKMCYVITGLEKLKLKKFDCELLQNGTDSFLPLDVARFYFTEVKNITGEYRDCTSYLSLVDQGACNKSGRDITAVDRCKNGVFNKVFYLNDVPQYCTVVEKGPLNGKCVNITQLYSKFRKYQHDIKSNGHLVDYADEYKRFNEEKLSRIYSLSPPFDSNFGDYWDRGFDALFVQALLFLGKIHPELSTVNFNGTEFAATGFCDIALRFFPLSSYIVFTEVPPEDCPQILNEKCTHSYCKRMLGNFFKMKQNDFIANRANFAFPTNLSLVYYEDKVTPRSCYVPKGHYDFPGDFSGGCISFKDAVGMLNNKDGMSSGSSLERIFYMSGVLRLYYKPRENDSTVPWDYLWDAQRKSGKSTTEILLQLDNALGYKEDNRINFEVADDGNNRRKVSMSYQAFCTVIVEMAPFATEVLRQNTKSCTNIHNS